MKRGKHYRNTILTGRFSGPMVCFLSVIMMLATLFEEPKDPMPIWGRVLGFAVFFEIFILAVRWTKSCWKTKL